MYSVEIIESRLLAMGDTPEITTNCELWSLYYIQWVLDYPNSCVPFKSQHRSDK